MAVSGEDGYVLWLKTSVLVQPLRETALADAEVEYDNHTSDSVYVKFRATLVPPRGNGGT
ncbi:MAG: hypothetical protein U0003_01655 [Vampirovibrionales bacterium]